MLAGGDGAALNRLAAAELWRASRYRAPLLDRRAVATHDPRASRCTGARTSTPRDVTVHRGIPVTTVARTLVDLTDTLIAEELTNVIHEAAFRRRFSIPETREAMARANGRRKLARLDEAIELWLAGSAGLKSRLERAFLRLVIEAGLTKPIPNIHVAGAEVDAYWPDLRLVVEIDGPNHTRPPTLRADGSQRPAARRERASTVLRFTEFELERRPGDVVAALVRAGCR